MSKVRYFQNIIGTDLLVSDINVHFVKDEIKSIPSVIADKSADLFKGCLDEVVDVNGMSLMDAPDGLANDNVAKIPDFSDPQCNHQDAADGGVLREDAWSVIYENLNVSEIEGLVNSIEEVSVVKEILDYELSNKNRKTANAVIEARIAQLV